MRYQIYIKTKGTDRQIAEFLLNIFSPTNFFKTQFLLVSIVAVSQKPHNYHIDPEEQVKLFY